MDVLNFACLLLLKVIHGLGKLNGGRVVAALSHVLFSIENSIPCFYYKYGTFPFIYMIKVLYLSLIN